jgi:membrane-bound ClpP family serine protease
MSAQHIVLIVDIGRTMVKENRVVHAKEAVRELVLKKLMTSKRDKIGLVVFGSIETNNQLADIQDGGYRHVIVPQTLDSRMLYNNRTKEKKRKKRN